MTYEGSKLWTTPARGLVLYNADAVWRFAIHNEAGIIDGRLELSATVPFDEAQRELLRRMTECTGLVYEAKWSSTKPTWWTAMVTVVGQR